MLWVFVDLLTFVVAFDCKNFYSLFLKDMMLHHSPQCPSNQFLNHQMVQPSNTCPSSLEDLLHELAGHLCWDSLLLSLEVRTMYTEHLLWILFTPGLYPIVFYQADLWRALLMPSYRSYHTPLMPARSWPCMHAGVSSTSCFVPVLGVFA